MTLPTAIINGAKHFKILPTILVLVGLLIVWRVHDFITTNRAVNYGKLILPEASCEAISTCYFYCGGASDIAICTSLSKVYQCEVGGDFNRTRAYCNDYGNRIPLY